MENCSQYLQKIITNCSQPGIRAQGLCFYSTDKVHRYNSQCQTYCAGYFNYVDPGFQCINWIMVIGRSKTYW